MIFDDALMEPIWTPMECTLNRMLENSGKDVVMADLISLLQDWRHEKEERIRVHQEQLRTCRCPKGFNRTGYRCYPNCYAPHCVILRASGKTWHGIPKKDSM